MRRILIASSKGGCGKTTVTTNLAAYYSRGGRRTVVLDCDRQGSARDWWLQRGPLDDRLKVVSGTADEGLLWSLKIPATTEVVLVDTPAGVHGPQLGNLVRRCDTLIIPVLPSEIDWRATSAYLEELKRLPELRAHTQLRIGLLINRMRERTLSARALQNHIASQGLPCLGSVRDTKAYVLAAALGKSIFDFDTPPTREHQDDWRALLAWLDAPRAASSSGGGVPRTVQQGETVQC